MLRTSPKPEPDLRSAMLLSRLRARGLRARLAMSECCGERDIRICVHRRLLGPAVELLCCTADDPQQAQWHAVRLTGDQRTVWRGPACDGDLDSAVAFVDDLLALDETALAGRYLRLG